MISERQKRIHILKTWSTFFDSVWSGHKTFEIRKNDRDYQVGDTLVLVRCSTEAPHLPTESPARFTCREVVYVMQGPAFGLAEGYVALGIAPVAWVPEYVVQKWAEGLREPHTPPPPLDPHEADALLVSFDMGPTEALRLLPLPREKRIQEIRLTIDRLDGELHERLASLGLEIERLDALGSWVIRGPRSAITVVTSSEGPLKDMPLQVAKNTLFFATNP